MGVGSGPIGDRYRGVDLRPEVGGIRRRSWDAELETSCDRQRLAARDQAEERDGGDMGAVHEREASGGAGGRVKSTDSFDLA